MKLINLDNFDIKFDPELLLLKPFRKLYNADTSKNKDKFMDLLTILYFVYDPRSEYQYIVDEERRIEAVCVSNGIKQKPFTKDEQACMDIYKKCCTTSSSLLLEDTRAAIDNIRKILREIDYTGLDEKDKISAVKTVAATTSMVPKLIKDLSEAEKLVTKELKEIGVARGNEGRKSLMDDGILL